MSEGEEIASKIAELGATIAAAKKEKKPIEEWQSTLDEMLALKVSYLNQMVHSYFLQHIALIFNNHFKH